MPTLPGMGDSPENTADGLGDLPWKTDEEEAAPSAAELEAAGQAAMFGDPSPSASKAEPAPEPEPEPEAVTQAPQPSAPSAAAAPSTPAAAQRYRALAR